MTVLCYPFERLLALPGQGLVLIVSLMFDNFKEAIKTGSKNILSGSGYGGFKGRSLTLLHHLDTYHALLVSGIRCAVGLTMAAAQT